MPLHGYTSAIITFLLLQELQFNVGRQEVDISMHHIEAELKRSKNEICDIRCELEVKEGHWWDEKQRMEREKLELIKVSNRGQGSQT